jgi:hypothetical protein
VARDLDGHAALRGALAARDFRLHLEKFSLLALLAPLWDRAGSHRETLCPVSVILSLEPMLAACIACHRACDEAVIREKSCATSLLFGVCHRRRTRSLDRSRTSSRFRAFEVHEPRA